MFGQTAECKNKFRKRRITSLVAVFPLDDFVQTLLPCSYFVFPLWHCPWWRLFTYVWHRHQHCYISEQNMWGHQTCIHLCEHLPSFDNWIKKRLKYKIYIFSLVEIITLENFFMHGNRNSSVAKNQVINNFDSIPKTLTTCRAYLVLSSVWVTVWVNILFDQLQPKSPQQELFDWGPNMNLLLTLTIWPKYKI